MNYTLHNLLQIFKTLKKTSKNIKKHKNISLKIEFKQFKASPKKTNSFELISSAKKTPK